MDWTIAVRLFLGVALLAMNGFFVTTEFALTRVRQFSQDEFSGNAGLERAWEMTDQLEVYLSSCQVGITISSVALGVVAEPAVTKLFGGLMVSLGLAESAHTLVSIVISLAIINILHVVVAEQIPTYLGVERSRQVARYCAIPLYYWMKIMYPVVVLSDKTAKMVLSLFGVEITRSWTEEEEGPKNLSELKREMGVMMSGMAITDERKREVMNALEISTIPVEEIMVPSEDVAFLSKDNSLDETVEYVQNHPHTRYPLFDPDSGEFVGLIYSAVILQNIDQLESGERSLENLATELPVVSESMPVSDVIDYFQARKQELALVSAGGGETPIERSEVRGLVTSTDAMEEVTGQIEDPLD